MRRLYQNASKSVPHLRHVAGMMGGSPQVRHAVHFEDLHPVLQPVLSDIVFHPLCGRDVLEGGGRGGRAGMRCVPPAREREQGWGRSAS